MEDKIIIEDSNTCEAEKPSVPIFVKAWRVFSTVLLVLVMCLAVMLAGVRIFGYKPYAVLSGSMTPTYKVGSLVYVHSVDFSDIKVGDAITFVAGPDKTVVTHRVVEIDKTEQTFRTKGDANQDVDSSAVYYKNVLGRVSFSVPLLGYISMYISTTSGRFAVLAVFFLLIAVMLVPEIVKSGKVQK